MPVTLESLGIDKLSRDEQIVLVQEIWDSIGSGPLIHSLGEATRSRIIRQTCGSPATEYDQEPMAPPEPEDIARPIFILPARAYLRAMLDVAICTFRSPFADTVIDLGPSLIDSNEVAA